MNVVAIDGRHSSTVEETGYRGTAGQLRSKGPRWLAGARAFARRGGGGGGKGHDLDSGDDTLTHRERKKPEPRKGEKTGRESLHRKHART